MNKLLKNIAIVMCLIIRSQAMEVEYKETNMNNCPKKITCEILKHYPPEEKIIRLGTDVSFKAIFQDLQLVCKNWQSAIEYGMKKNKQNILINAIISAYDSLGYGDDCQRFLNGKLVYTPENGEKIQLYIADLEKPLGGEFNLSNCRDAAKYMSIATGYRKGKKQENANKVEIWFCPRFVIEQNLKSSACHFQPIFESWDNTLAPIAIFWTWGNWNELKYYDYLTSKNVEFINDKNLSQLYYKVPTVLEMSYSQDVIFTPHYCMHLSMRTGFHVYFNIN